MKEMECSFRKALFLFCKQGLVCHSTGDWEIRTARSEAQIMRFQKRIRTLSNCIRNHLNYTSAYIPGLHSAYVLRID